MALREEATSCRSALLRAQEASAGWEEALAEKEREAANLQVYIGKAGDKGSVVFRQRLVEGEPPAMLSCTWMFLALTLCPLP